MEVAVRGVSSTAGSQGTSQKLLAALQLTRRHKTAVLVLRWHCQGEAHAPTHTRTHTHTHTHTHMQQQLEIKCKLISLFFLTHYKMWDTESGEKLQDIRAHRGAILSCHVSPDGCLFATTSADMTAKVQHLHTHTHRHTHTQNETYLFVLPVTT